MDPTTKQQPAAGASQPAAAVATKAPTTLLDAYEVECIRRELERLLLRHNAGERAEGSSNAVLETHSLRHRQRRDHHHRSSRKKTISGDAKNDNHAPAPPPPGAKKGAGGGVRLLGRHAVAICSSAMAVAPVAGAAGRRRRRAGYREVEKV